MTETGGNFMIAMMRRLRSGAGGIRFDRTALSAVALSIVLLYGAALGESFGWLPNGIWLGERTAGTGGPTWLAERRAPRPPKEMRGAAPWLVKPVETTGALVDFFRRVDYRLDAVREGDQSGPRIVVEQVPTDLHRLEPAAHRKRVFIKLILPLVLFENERILADRKRLVELNEDIKRFGRIPDPGDRAWLSRMCERYGLDVADANALLRRLDVIPPSLAVAQAAEESGWGTSRFVRLGNAVFGQRTFAVGAGLVPLRRGENSTYEVRSFGRLLDSVAAYMFNLNSHSAYGRFRRAREHLRRTRGEIDGHALASTLDRYSERRGAYVRAIRAIIFSGGLRELDRARLRDGRVVATVKPEA